MRLIDADKLVERLKSDIIHQQRIIDMKLNNGIKDYRDNQFLAMYRFALDIICNEPTVNGECKICKYADWYPDTELIYCLEHSCVMAFDEFCSRFEKEAE